MKKNSFEGITILKKVESVGKRRGLESPKAVAPARSAMATVSNSAPSRGTWFIYILLFCAGAFIAFSME